jgi:Nucleotide modification associated domain 1
MSDSINTYTQYDSVVERCRTLFQKKTADYGTAWRIMRLPSITDQIMIKANRIRSIQTAGVQLIDDPIDTEFVGIINYCIMALMQLRLPEEASTELPVDTCMKVYDEVVSETKDLLFKKNHDYGEAWRQMRISSMTDIILMKLLRTKQIEDNQGQTLVSEGVAANYQDMMNYSIFCLILMGEENSN